MAKSRGEERTDPLVGEVIAGYEIREKLGEGGFGSVYKAWDRDLQRDVALKVMLQSLTSNLEYVQKFIREAITAAQLNHPNIVGIHRVGRDEERNLHFLVMEFLEGETLSDLIDRQGAMAFEDAINIILQCADALAVAQEKNIIHRDIKPENIMIDKHGNVKITDFGLARTLTAAAATKVMGTPHYMSPEQFEGKPVDGRTDIYSLGVTFYYLLSGNLPFTGPSVPQIIYRVLTEEPTPVTKHVADLPAGIWEILRKMIAKKASDRYATFREVQADLASHRDGMPPETTTCGFCGASNGFGEERCARCGKALLPVVEDSLLPATDAHPAEALTKELPGIRELATYTRSGRFALAASRLGSLLEDDPLHADLKEAIRGLVHSMQERLTQLHLDQAKEAMEEGHLRAAQEAFEEVTRVAPDTGDLGEKVAEVSRLLDDLNLRMTEEEDKLLGRKLGKWVLNEVLGEGRFGKVYRGYESRLRRAVAVKVLRREFYSDQKYTDRFLKEARIVAGLTHENIVGLFDVGWDGDLLVHYLVMEYIPGGSLSSLAEGAQPVPVAAAVGIVLQCARALQAAHARGVVHRDIKPANILITPEGLARITDFGLARSPDHTRNTTGIAGTPHYMSLEQWQGIEDLRTDIYALGVTLFVLLGKATPYEGDTPPQLLYRLSREEPLDLASIRSDLPGPLLDVVYRMMAKEVGDRYQTMQEVVTALEDGVRSAGIDLTQGTRWVAKRVGIGDESSDPETRTL